MEHSIKKSVEIYARQKNIELNKWDRLIPKIDHIRTEFLASITQKRESK